MIGWNRTTIDFLPASPGFVSGLIFSPLYQKEDIKKYFQTNPCLAIINLNVIILRIKIEYQEGIILFYLKKVTSHRNHLEVRFYVQVLEWKKRRKNRIPAINIKISLSVYRVSVNAAIKNVTYFIAVVLKLSDKTTIYYSTANHRKKLSRGYQLNNNILIC